MTNLAEITVNNECDKRDLEESMNSDVIHRSVDTVVAILGSENSMQK